jgi:hypothetical protein
MISNTKQALLSSLKSDIYGTISRRLKRMSKLGFSIEASHIRSTGQTSHGWSLSAYRRRSASFIYVFLCQKNLAANALWSPMSLIPAHLLPIRTSLKGTRSGILLEITLVQLYKAVELSQKISLTMRLYGGIIVSHIDKHTGPSNTN